MSLKDIAGQLNPGGPEAAAREGEAERALATQPEPVAEEPAPAVVEEGGGRVRGRRSGRRSSGRAAAAGSPRRAPAPPAPPADVWEIATPDDRTQAYQTVGVKPPAAETPVPAAAAPRRTAAGRATRAASPPPPDPLAADPPRAP